MDKLRVILQMVAAYPSEMVRREILKNVQIGVDSIPDFLIVSGSWMVNVPLGLSLVVPDVRIYAIGEVRVVDSFGAKQIQEADLQLIYDAIFAVQNGDLQSVVLIGDESGCKLDFRYSVDIEFYIAGSANISCIRILGANDVLKFIFKVVQNSHLLIKLISVRSLFFRRTQPAISSFRWDALDFIRRHFHGVELGYVQEYNLADSFVQVVNNAFIWSKIGVGCETQHFVIVVCDGYNPFPTISRVINTRPLANTFCPGGAAFAQDANFALMKC